MADSVSRISSDQTESTSSAILLIKIFVALLLSSGIFLLLQTAAVLIAIKFFDKLPDAKIVEVRNLLHTFGLVFSRILESCLGFSSASEKLPINTQLFFDDVSQRLRGIGPHYVLAISISLSGLLSGLLSGFLRLWISSLVVLLGLVLLSNGCAYSSLFHGVADVFPVWAYFIMLIVAFCAGQAISESIKILE